MKQKLPYYRYILPTIISFITGESRYLPNFEWNKNLYTHNVFRFWEYIAFRKFGIRAETSCDSNGNIICHSWESKIAHTETRIRSFLHRLKFVKVPLPVFITPEGIKIQMFPVGYLFAIAIDTNGTSTDGSGSTTANATMTISGSDINLVCGVVDQNNNGNVTSVVRDPTGAAEALTRIAVKDVDGSYDIEAYIYWLASAPTGSQTVRATRTPASDRITICMASYSGCDATVAASVTFTSGNGTSTSNTGTLTTTVDNAWTAMMNYTHGDTTPTAGAGTTIRQNATDGNGCNLADSGGAISPAGSTSLIVNKDNSIGAWVMVEIKPVSAVVAYIPKIIMS